MTPEDLEALAERLEREAEAGYCRDTCGYNDLRQAAAALRSCAAEKREAERVRLDAERYRWLKSQAVWRRWGANCVRINVYSQELTNEVHRIEKVSNTGLTYSAVQLMLHSSPMLHHPPEDDDRSAVTLWLPKSAHRCEELAATLERMAMLVREAPPETGLD